MATIKIADDVLAVLSACTMNGSVLVLPGDEPLDRKLYEAVNKVIEAAGGKWNRKAKGHVFEGDALDAIDPIVLTGEYSRIKQDFGFFETPAAVVERMCEKADLCRGLVCLEPSAGRSGQLVFPMLDAKPKRLDCYELQDKNADRLDERICNYLAPASREHVTVTTADFLTITPVRKYNLVMMNPPFAKRADLRHVMHAKDFLVEDGRMVAIMSAGVEFRNDTPTRHFREWVASKGGTIERLPEDSFRESGTGVNTVLVEFSV